MDQSLLETVVLTFPTGVVTPEAKCDHKRKASVLNGSKAETSRTTQIWTDPNILTHPDSGCPIRNQGEKCAINVVLQTCFQVPRITRLLESSTHPQIASLRSLYDRYKGGTGPITIGTLDSLIPPDIKSRTTDAEEILTGICALLGQERTICHLSPEETLTRHPHLPIWSVGPRGIQD